MNEKVVSTQWIPSLLARTMNNGEVALSILKYQGYKWRIEDPEEDLDS